MGRLRLPFYLYSDFASIGYSYPWISPPEAGYFYPLSTVDGDLFEFADFSLQYNDMRYLAVFESTYMTAHDNAPLPDGFNYFLTAGIRQENRLYHINYSREKDMGPDIGNDLPKEEITRIYLKKE